MSIRYDELDYYDNDELVFFKRCHIPRPDQIMDGTVLDHVVRAYEDREYPFLDRHKEQRKGCYLIYDTHMSCSKCGILPIYAGRSINLGKRLYEHWCSKTEQRLSKYHEIIDAEQLLCPHVEQESGVERRWNGIMFIAIWFIGDDKQRMYFEHRLIGNCKPILNVG